MTTPQLENGYIKIATELYDALCGIRIPGEARQVFDVILRKTYGWNKKKDAIALSQFVEATGGFAGIGSLRDAPAIMRQEAGTIVVPDAEG